MAENRKLFSLTFDTYFWLFLACRGGSERPCHGNGHCDGDGTRGGDGSCSCNKEYTGDFCLDCSNGYFSTLRNETHSVCTGNEVFDTCLDLCLPFSVFVNKTRNNLNWQI